MIYDEIADRMSMEEEGVAISTMMKSPCLRYEGDFFAMDSEKMDALIVKLSPDRVDELIAGGEGLEFNFTKKKFREWVLIPRGREDTYEGFFREALAYSKSKAE
ncbi:MAG: hypothetical protein ACPGRZ_00785 [Alphaproteobacteria bacterium]